jgi:hypothetical protein
MSEESSTSKLLYLRKVTRAVSEYLSSQLHEQLQTIAPLLRARRLLGDYIESGNPEPVIDAEKNFNALNHLFARVSGKPFDLPRPLRPPLKPVALSLEAYPWEYKYEIRTRDASKTITVTSPVRWVISYASGFSLARLSRGAAGREEQKKEDVRDFVVRCCLMSLMLQKYPGIRSLLEALRWQVSEETMPGLGELPLTTLSAPLQTMLPPDDLILESTELVGLPQFEEVADIDALMRIPDPLAAKVAEIVRSAKP